MSDFNGLGPWTCFEDYIHKDIERALEELIPILLDHANDKSSGMGIEFEQKENPATTWDSIYISQFPPNWSYQNKLTDKSMYRHPHFTICIENNRLWLQLVIPSRAYVKYWNQLILFLSSESKVIAGLSEISNEIPELWLVLLHRHSADLGNQDVVDDGRMEFKFGNIDEQAVFENDKFKPIPAWLKALNQVIINKKRDDKPNIEFSFRALYNIDPGSVSSRYRHRMEIDRQGRRRNIDPTQSMFYNEIKLAFDALWPLYLEIIEIK